ncbi:MAG: hypothetical protein BroJett040_11580 [Oligoflexia bacterium]|nr:MAG: hypothetical protein BroJett040_11580 [Oligoflexia bacterium]
MLLILRFLSGIFLALSSIAEAGLLRTQSETYFSQRTGDNKKLETPIYEQFSATYLTTARTGQFDMNFGYYYDFSKNIYDFDLHLLKGDFHFDQSHLSMGRQFETFHLIKATIIDSVSYDYQFSPFIRAGVVAGKARQFELGSDEKEALISGVYADLQTENVFPWRSGLHFENRDFSSTERSRQNWVKWSLKKEWPITLHPEFLFNIEENLDHSKGYRREAGVDFYPNLNSSYGVRAQVYHLDSGEFWEDPISSIFTQGEVQEVSGLFHYLLTPEWSTGFDLGYDQYLVQQNQKTTGYRAEWSLKWTRDGRGIENSVFRISSFGGWVNGNKLRVTYPWTDKFDFEFNQDYVQYQKVTSAQSLASSTQAGMGYWLWRQCRLWVAAELNSNHFYSQDVSFLTRLTIYDWREL